MSLTKILFRRFPFLETLSTFFLDTLFPLSCFGCGTPDTYLCSLCAEKLPLHTKQRCPHCHKTTTPHGELCFACCDIAPALDGLFAPALYRSPFVSLLIHTYKYRFISLLAEPLGFWLAQQMIKTDLPLPDYVIPVPLHKRRLRFRGFNQSELLANALAQHVAPHLHLPVLSDALLRINYTKPQIKTDSREERLKNLKNAFIINDSRRNELLGKYIWLIDDVATTGATLTECATILKRAGATKVFGIVIAR
ncbi:MAG: ComF family protein [Candidatus Moranbacteria bacterium]|nr:ComF family protein [Candidatus Moranbacteria bacterium]